MGGWVVLACVLWRSSTAVRGRIGSVLMIVGILGFGGASLLPALGHRLDQIELPHTPHLFGLTPPNGDVFYANLSLRRIQVHGRDGRFLFGTFAPTYGNLVTLTLASDGSFLLCTVSSKSGRAPLSALASSHRCTHDFLRHMSRRKRSTAEAGAGDRRNLEDVAAAIEGSVVAAGTLGMDLCMGAVAVSDRSRRSASCDARSRGEAQRNVGLPVKRGFDSFAGDNIEGCSVADQRDLTLILPDELASRVRERMAAGSYASELDVLRDGIDALDERDDARRQWLETTVAERYKAFKSGRETTHSFEEVHARLDARFDRPRN
jgi:antitoxin ParD1/3/4